MRINHPMQNVGGLEFVRLGRQGPGMKAKAPTAIIDHDQRRRPRNPLL
jgi:hypothetical protein